MRYFQRLSWPQILVLLFVLSACISLTLGVGFFYRSDALHLDADEAEYWSLSTNLLSMKFDDPGRRTLGFPLVLAVLRSALKTYPAVQIAVTLLASTAAPLLAQAVFRASRNRAAATVAGIGLSIWPPQIFLATSLYSETIALPLFLSVLCLLPSASGRPAIRQFVYTGIVLGLLCHVRTMYQLFIPCLALIILIEHRSLTKTALYFLTTLAGFLLVVLPWSLFISERTHSTILLTANGGETLAGGLNPVVLAAHSSVRLEKRVSWIGPGKWIPATQTGYLSNDDLKKSYGEQNKLLTSRTIKWIISNPGAAAYITVRKITYMWGVYPFFGSSTLVTIFGNIPIILVLASFIAVIAKSTDLNKSASRFYLTPLFVTGIAIISWGSWRFRQPADAAMIALIAWGLTDPLLRFLKDKRGMSVPAEGQRQAATIPH